MILYHNANVNNFRFGNDEMTLLGDTLTLGIDEEELEDGFLGTSLMNRLNKVKDKTLRWENTNNFSFPMFLPDY